MKPIVWISVVLLTLAGLSLAAGMWWRQSAEPEWTSESPQALKELELGWEAMMKHYAPEAKAHFDRAVELDPELAMAKLGQLAYTHVGTEHERLLAELRAVDTERLNPRERFMIGFWVARLGGEPERASAVLEKYAETDPDDVFALEARCELAWEAEQWDEAERCYQRMLELKPSWVNAQNRLGYISMGRGDFEEAEQRFRTHRFIAPDQALPHDALGELLILRGRYREAEEALDAALAVKPDFCDTYRHRVRLFAYSGQLDRAEAEVARVEAVAGCEMFRQWGYPCLARTWLRNMRGDYEAAWQVGTSAECTKVVTYKLYLHRAALFTGRFGEAVAFEDELRRGIEKMSNAPPRKLDHERAVLLHMQGLRALAEGDAAAAARHLGAADGLLTYWEPDQANFKQLNRASLVRSLEQQGRVEEARAIWVEVKKVNPNFGPPSSLAASDPLTAWNGPGERL